MAEKYIAVVDKSIDRAVALAALELVSIAEFYKRHNKVKQASEVERAIAQFNSKSCPASRNDPA